MRGILKSVYKSRLFTTVSITLSLFTLVSCKADNLTPSANTISVTKFSSTNHSTDNSSSDKTSSVTSDSVKIITNSSEKEEDSPNSLKVMVDGKLYSYTGFVNSNVTCGTPDGRITSTVDPSESPQKNDQSNFGKGYKYQFGDKDELSINFSDKWLFFRNVTSNSSKLPEGVASFKAKVVSFSDNQMLVKVVDIPEEFKYIFKNGLVNGLPKPISLNLKDFAIAGKTDLSEKDIKGKLIRVWFDGNIKNEAPETSYPIELGEVYSISLLKEPI